MIERNIQQARAGALNLHGLLAHWSEVATEAWVTALLGWEEQERARRSLERRLGCVPLASAALSQSATSTGVGQNAATASPSMR